jgi:apolipoprotein D and lipocalin family protein
MKEHFYPILLLLISCATHPPLKKVENVDLKRFMGKWYVIANIPTFIEKGAHNAVETYTWNKKEKRIDVLFTDM